MRASRFLPISSAIADKFNVAEDGTAVMPGDYLEVVVTKKR